MFVCKDPGGTNGILPVHRAWCRSGGRAALIANGTAVDLLLQRDIAFRWYPSPAAAHADIPHPAALVTCMSSRGGLGRDLIPLLRGRYPTIALQDLWDGQLWTDWADPVYRPDAIVVNDVIGVEIIERAWPEYHQERIAVLGYPALDRYATLDVAATSTAARARLGIAPDEHVVLAIGALASSGTFLAEVVAALNELRNAVCLLPRTHPRMVQDAPEEQVPWEHALHSFTCGRVIADSSACTTDECVAASSVVIGMFSTVLVEAATIRRACIAVLYPNVGMAAFQHASEGHLDEFVPVALGACAKATDRASLVAALIAARDGSLAAQLQPAQECAFPTDGLAAERVAAYIRHRIATYDALV